MEDSIARQRWKQMLQRDIRTCCVTQDANSMIYLCKLTRSLEISTQIKQVLYDLFVLLSTNNTHSHLHILCVVYLSVMRYGREIKGYKFHDINFEQVPISAFFGNTSLFIFFPTKYFYLEYR